MPITVIQLPQVQAFPVVIPAGFKPSDIDADGTDLGPSGKVCPGYDAASGYRPRWGGGFLAPRGPQKLAHRAIDIMAAEGAHVVAPEAGVIRDTGTSPKGGHHLYLVGHDGWIWYLAHLRDPARVLAGMEVGAGDVLGLVGRTGNAVRTTRAGLRGCPHLHLSLTRPRGVRLNPVLPGGERVALLGDKVDPVPVLRTVYDAGWR